MAAGGRWRMVGEGLVSLGAGWIGRSDLDTHETGADQGPKPDLRPDLGQIWTPMKQEADQEDPIGTD